MKFLYPFKSLFSTNSPSSEDINIFLSKHRRKLILAAFTLSNKDKPSVFVNICGLPDDIDLTPVLDNKYSEYWKNVIVVSKYENSYSDLSLKDLLINKSSQVNIYNIDMSILLTALSDNDKHYSKFIKYNLDSCLYIFDGYDWFEILNLFTSSNIEISGGIGVKSHIISPNLFKLNIALVVLNIPFKSISKYFHYTNYLSSKFHDDESIYNSKSSFINPNFYNSGFDNGNNRTFSTFSKKNYLIYNKINTRSISTINRRSLSAINSVSRKSLYFEYSYIYLLIKDIINAHNPSNYDKQLSIEKLLNETWYDISIDNLSKINTHNKDYKTLLTLFIDNFRGCLLKYVNQLNTKHKYSLLDNSFKGRLYLCNVILPTLPKKSEFLLIKANL